MAWYWIVLITLAIHSIIGVIISVIGKDEWLEAWGVHITKDDESRNSYE